MNNYKAMRKAFIIILTLMTAKGVIGQTAVPASGGTVSNAEGMFSFTLGQPFAQSDFETAVSINTVTAYVIEGVQQPFTIEQLSIEGTSSLPVTLTIFPNPTTGIVTVTSDSPDKLTYTLYSLDGRKMQQGTWSESVRLNLEGYTAGSYLLDIADMKGNKNIYKIIKSN